MPWISETFRGISLSFVLLFLLKFQHSYACVKFIYTYVCIYVFEFFTQKTQPEDWEETWLLKTCTFLSKMQHLYGRWRKKLPWQRIAGPGVEGWRPMGPWDKGKSSVEHSARLSAGFSPVIYSQAGPGSKAAQENKVHANICWIYVPKNYMHPENPVKRNNMIELD